MTSVKDTSAAPKEERDSPWTYLFGFLLLGFFGFKFLEALNPEWDWYANGTLSAQVYIVTEGTDVHRLPLAEIKIIRERDVEGWIAECADRRDGYRKQAQEVAAQIAPLLAEKENFLQQQQSLVGERNTAFKALDDWKARYAHAPNTSDIHLETQTQIINKWHPKIDDLGEKIRACEARIDALLQEGAHLRSLANRERLEIARGPIQTVARTTTDTEGRFKVRIPRHGRFAVSAFGRRQTDTGVERLRWLVWVDMEGKRSLSIDLNNKNIDGAATPQSALPLPAEW